MNQVLVAGIAVLDCVFEVSQIPASAEKHIAHDVQLVVGGCAANAAIAISRLGGRAFLAAQLGDDIAASVISDTLQSEGVDLSYCARFEHSRSALSCVSVDQQGERQIVNFRGDHAGRQLPKPLFADQTHTISPDAVLVDTRWLDGAEQALDLGLSLQIPRVLDAEAPIPTALLQKASHIAFSRSGLLSLGYASELRQALMLADKNLPAWVCVTDGADGVYSLRNGQLHHHPAFAVETLDTLGAGDVWHGAFCLQLANGLPEAHCIRFANATAALKCRQRGGGAVTPDLAAVQAFLGA